MAGAGVELSLREIPGPEFSPTFPDINLQGKNNDPKLIAIEIADWNTLRDPLGGGGVEGEVPLLSERDLLRPEWTEMLRIGPFEPQRFLSRERRGQFSGQEKRQPPLHVDSE